MALEEQGRRVNKRNRNFTQNQRKLLFGAKVEVRNEEEGFQGSWHPGTITACTKGCREVKYDHILCDDGSGNLVDAVCVSPILDGLDSVTDEQSNHRGSIRPKPPKIEVGIWDLPYGLCVDVYHRDAWWEGVVFDHEDGSEKRRIFFPDLGDELTTGIDTIRLTQDWDAVTENWRRRGTWIFLELIEQYEQQSYIAVSVKQVWYDVRLKEGFQKVREWTSPMRYQWEELVLEVIDDNLSITADEICQRLEVSGCLSRESQVEFESTQCVLDANVNLKSYIADSLAIVPVGNPLDSNLSVDRDAFMKNVLDCRDGVTDEQSEGLSIVPDSTCVQHIQDKSNVVQLISVKQDELPKMNVLENSNLSLQNKGVFVLHQVLSGVPSYLEEHSSAKSDISSDGICVSKSKGRRPAKWLPAELPKESCPGAVDEYVNLRKGQRAIRKHLLYSGWKVEYMIDKGRYRFRYLPPNGQPEYSLVKVCSNLRKSSNDSQFAISQDAPQDGSNGQPLVTEQPQEIQHPRYCPKHVVSPFPNSKLQPKVFIYKPEYCPQAVVAYVDSPTRGPRSERAKALRSKAKKHLSAVGWEFYYSEVRSLNNLRFKSPKGNVYNSLLNACKACMDEENSEERPAKCRYVIEEDAGHLTKNKIFSAANRKRERKRIRSYSTPHLLHGRLKDQCANPSKLKRRKASASSSGFKNGSGGSQPTRVLRSSKRVQEVVTPNSTHQNPRTVLSWLIDNNVVLPRKKVHYCSRKGGPSMAEGKISREGIKCSCCQKVFSLSCFESHAAGFNDPHAGCSDHKPASNIFLDDDHTGCLRKGGVDMSESDSKGNWFCSKNCKKISLGLHKLLGKQFPVGVGKLTWSLLKSMKSETDNDAITESFSRLSIALDVMHECFEPVKEPLTRRDLVEDIIFSRGSNLNRLNFQGFYTLLLERNDELITAATVRIHGEKVAEVPLVATRFQYRRQGMCRVLINLLEKMLMDLGVERLVLPAVPSVLNTWTTAFGFSRMTKPERLQFLDHTFLDFQDTLMCQKLLMKISAAEPSLLIGTQPQMSRSADIVDLDESSVASEVCQPERTEDSQAVSWGLESTSGKRRPCIDKSCPEFKQYKRKRISNLAAVVV
ncbi:hypothetical protein ACLB2K_021669 [Fragaria x ananassa]